MAEPTVTIPTTGTDPKATTTEDFEAALNAVFLSLYNDTQTRAPQTDVDAINAALPTLTKDQIAAGLLSGVMEDADTIPVIKDVDGSLRQIKYPTLATRIRDYFIATFGYELDNIPSDTELSEWAVAHMLTTSRVLLRDAGTQVWVTVNKVMFPRLRLERDGETDDVTASPLAGGFQVADLSTSSTDPIYYWFDAVANAVTSGAALPVLTPDIVLLGASLAGEFRDRTGLPVIRREYVSRSIGADGLAYLLAGVLPDGTDNAGDVYKVTSTDWMEYTPRGRVGGMAYTVIDNAKLAISHLPIGSEVTIMDRADTGRMQVFAGHGKAFNGGTNNLLTFDVKGAVTIKNVQGIYYVTGQGSSTFTLSTMAAPVAQKATVLLGQSFMVRFEASGGVGGFTTAMRDDTWMEAVVAETYRFIQGATGGSTIFKSEASAAQIAADQFWIDDMPGGVESDTVLDWADGAAMITARAALAAAQAEGQPLPDVVFFQLGTSSMSAVESGATSVAKAQAGYQWIWDQIRTSGDTGANVKVIASVPGASVANLPKGASGIRQAVLQAIDANTWAYQGPETYDLFREDSESAVHLTADGWRQWGRRWARHYANVVHGQANNLGPKANVVLNADPMRITVNVTAASAAAIEHPDLNTGAFCVDDYPFGLGFVASGTDAGTALPEVFTFAEREASNNYTLQATASRAGGQLLHPCGLVETGTARFIRDIDGLPLRSFITVAL